MTQPAHDSAPRPLPQGPVNVLLIGSGGREHALAEAMRRSPRLGTLWIANPGNPGIDALGRPVDIPFERPAADRYRRLCARERIGLVVIGPEDPLADGWADELAKPAVDMPNVAGVTPPLIFGPTRAAARLEADKAWAKHMMRQASVPTAEGRAFTDYSKACAYLESREEDQVVKAAGLAKGKGVIVPATKEEALAALHQIMVERRFGDAGREVVIEERLTGPEVSVLALVDGRNIMVLPLCQDHKRLRDGDLGPNTGGMGAFSPVETMTDDVLRKVEAEVLVPIVDALRTDEIEFRGVLYAGLMLTPAGPKVLEFNTRFGDPECQPVMARLESDAIELLAATAAGRLDEVDVRWSDDPAVCVVIAADGYPESPRKGDPISGLDEAAAVEGVRIYHAGTTRRPDGTIVTSGGRVLGVTGRGADLAEARARAYEAVARISFRQMQVRRDIASPTASIVRR